MATDVAARGIHVDDVSVVLQLDPPMTSKDYLHRSGRTARAGESGTVVSLVLPHQRRTVLRLAGQAGAKPQLVQVDPSAEAVVEVAGEWSDRAPAPMLLASEAWAKGAVRVNSSSRPGVEPPRRHLALR